MKWTSLNDLREKYLSFFESKGHLRLGSFSLVPRNDPSLLLINSGMAPMKKYFTGEETPPCPRVTTCQKCIRTPDLDRVGKTARHGTFFEMLGNFSFGDYFKTEAIRFAWEFLTVTLEIPGELLYPSIYEGDEEAYEIWTKDIGVPPERVVRLGKADNFWEHGSGPCGPCSEIYFDRGLKYGCGSPDCKPGCDCDRFMEIWNNVFSQFSNDGKGNYTELAQKNIDTGMGLERLACVFQGVDNLFEVDTVRALLDLVCAISGKTYGVDTQRDDVSIRIITDHVRGSVFMISDGIIPSNEGRGYVLRRLLRRALRHGRLLGIKGKFLERLCEEVIRSSEAGYPELREKHDFIIRTATAEESRFDATVEGGLAMLSTLTDEALKSGKTEISGEEVFRLYDTYGFPPDLTGEILAERGLDYDRADFDRLMDEQRRRAREARKNISGWANASAAALPKVAATEFVGYTADSCEGRVLAILTEGESVEACSEGDCLVVTDLTPFYGESGGQVGDTGSMTGEGLRLNITNTTRQDGIFLHAATVAEGVVKVGDSLTLTIDSSRRAAIRRNHSSAHLLQAALRRVLGEHVAQAGSYVDAERVRFDFSHYSAMTAEELASVEAIVNESILLGAPVETTVCGIEEARAKGAMALFGEKYGDRVRVVDMVGRSIELCGGTHVDNTAKIGLFKIISESSVAAGVRRIEGTTGLGVLQLLKEEQELAETAAREMKANNPRDIVRRAAALTAELKAAQTELESANSRLAAARLDSLVASAKTVGELRLVTARLDMKPEAARTLCDRVKDSYPDMVAVFALTDGEKVTYTAACGAAAVKSGANAGKIIKELCARVGGRGGGRPDSATGGGGDPSKIEEALASVAL